MQSGLAHRDLVVQIKIRRAAHDGSFLVVEGKDDERFWKDRCHDDCRLIDAMGKQNVIRGLQRLDEINFGRALGVVDSNHDYLEDTPLPSANLVRTDAHDLECLLCRSPALERVLAEYGDTDKIVRFEQRHGVDVRRALLDRGLVFGRLRWVARRFEPNLDLGDINPPRFIDESEWIVDEEEMVRVVASSNVQIDAQALQRQIAQLPPRDPWHVVHGHDLIEILKIGLRGVLGSLQTSIGREAIGGLLRQAMELQHLRSTGLWADMRRWEQSNEPFLVLRA